MPPDCGLRADRNAMLMVLMRLVSILRSRGDPVEPYG
jgi:hypothetical protein